MAQKTADSAGTDHARRYGRFRDRDLAVITLVRSTPEGDRSVPALVKDESYAGLACVLVGPPPAADERFLHEEAPGVRTPLAVRHHSELAAGIQLLGFERLDPWR